MRFLDPGRTGREHSAIGRVGLHLNGGVRIMRILIVSIAIGAGALMSSGANATPLTISSSMQPEAGIEQVRLVCDDYGHCYRTRGGRRVVIQQDYGDSYNYVPRERYVERRGYYDGGYGYY